MQMCCEGINNCKTGVSKKDGQHYKFEYVEINNLPNDSIKSSGVGSKRHKILSDEDKKKHQMEAVKKWQNKEYKCSRCGKTFKNNYKYAHNKKINE